MKDTKDNSPAPIRVFRPKWQVNFKNGTVYPATFNGIHLGTVADQTHSDGTDKSQVHDDKAFNPESDILFIENYVFKHCEDPNATTITLNAGDGLPGSLTSILNVAVDATSLSMERHDVWHKKLRFILRHLPRVRRITVAATVVLDTASPAPMGGGWRRRPVCLMDIQNVAAEDRSRLGILFGDGGCRGDVGVAPVCDGETGRPGDFVLRAWNDLSGYWPSWRVRREDGTAPCLFVTAMVYFRKEWVSLDGEGGGGGGVVGSCRLGSQRVDVPGSLVRLEVERQLAGEAGGKEGGGVAIGSALMRQKSVFSVGGKKRSLLLFRNRPSMPAVGC